MASRHEQGGASVPPQSATILRFPTRPEPELPHIEKSPELALLLAIYGELTPQQQSGARFTLWQMADRGSAEARAIGRLLRGEG